jgi:hypothetical protein
MSRAAGATSLLSHPVEAYYILRTEYLQQKSEYGRFISLGKAILGTKSRFGRGAPLTAQVVSSRDFPSPRTELPG